MDRPFAIDVKDCQVIRGSKCGLLGWTTNSSWTSPHGRRPNSTRCLELLFLRKLLKPQDEWRGDIEEKRSRGRGRGDEWDRRMPVALFPFDVIRAEHRYGGAGSVILGRIGRAIKFRNGFGRITSLSSRASRARVGESRLCPWHCRREQTPTGLRVYASREPCDQCCALGKEECVSSRVANPDFVHVRQVRG